MAEAAASTAYGPMVIAAVEQTVPMQQRIIDDPVAVQMLPTYGRLIVRACALTPLRQAFFNLVEKSTPGIFIGILCRKHYIDDKVLDALANGIDSLVILGAGLDTLPYRLPQLASIPVYDVDLPENIDHKKKKLEALYGSVPPRVRLVPINFEDQTLESVLQGVGYSFEQRSFFVWEGVTQYLTEAGVHATFEFLAKAKPGSRLVFTYVLKDFIDGQNLHGSDALYQRFRVKSQVWKFGIDPNQVAALIGGYGWKVLEQVMAEDYERRYLKPSGRSGSVVPIEPAVYAEKLPN